MKSSSDSRVGLCQKAHEEIDGRFLDKESRVESGGGAFPDADCGNATRSLSLPLTEATLPRIGC